jgi:hypothetical protein
MYILQRINELKYLTLNFESDYMDSRINKLAALIRSGPCEMCHVNYRLLPGGLGEHSLIIVLCAIDL